MLKEKRDFYYSTISLVVSVVSLLSVLLFRYYDKKETLSVQVVKDDVNYSKIIQSAGAGGNWGNGYSERTKERTIILSNLGDSKINISNISAGIEYVNSQVESKFCEVNFYNDKNERIYLPYELESNTSKIIYILIRFNVKDGYNKKRNEDLKAVGTNLKITTTKNNSFETFIKF